MKKTLSFIPLIAILCSCNTAANYVTSNEFYFDTMVQIKLYDGNKEDINNISSILKKYDGLTDNYENKINETGVYAINQTNETKYISNELYDILFSSIELKSQTNGYFNPLVGSLVKKWKDALNKKETLSNALIKEELEKINNSSLTFSYDEEHGYSITRNGEGQIDFGAIAKGYSLDKVKEYLSNKEEKQYLINGGSSSLLLGQKPTKDGLFDVGLKDVKNAYLKLKDCFISVSGTSEQGVEIDGKTYSHIINPFNGSAINNYDMTFVTGNNGAICDVLSTCFMMMDIDQIKEMEQTFNVSALIYKNKQFVYKNNNLEVKYH